MYDVVMYADGYITDIEGNIINKTKSEYPYSYDSIVVFRNFNLEADDRIWSDRLLQLDYEKYNTLSNKFFGDESQYWNGREPGKIQAFLSEWVGYDVNLVRVTEHCNASTGYPVWSFDFIKV